jgi:hypothetical protein
MRIAACNGLTETNIFSECFNAGTYWFSDKQLIGPAVFESNPLVVHTGSG